MKSLLLISLFLLVSCGKKTYMPVKQDPALMPFTEQFAEAAQTYKIDNKIRKISFRFGDLGCRGGGCVIGQCVIYQKQYFNGLNNEVYEYGREIVIDRSQYNSWTKNNTGIENLKQLLTHELGHCSLNRNHLDGEFQDGKLIKYPVSVMNSYHIKDMFNNNKSYYLMELFNRNPTQSYLAKYGSVNGSGSWSSTIVDTNKLASTYQNAEIESYDHGHEHVDGDEHELEEGHIKIVMLGENDEIE